MLKTNHFIINSAIFLKKLLPTLEETTGEPSSNQYLFDTSNVNGPTIKINSAAGVFGAINFPVFGLRKRDKIRVICEFISYSGTLPKIALDKYSGGGLDNTNNSSYSAGEWVQFDETFNITTNDTNFRIMVGLFTADVGIFAVRNLKIIVYSDTCVTLPDERIFGIRKINGAWEIDSRQSSDIGTLTTLNTQSLQLDFGIPFKYFGVPVAQVTQDYSTTISAVIGSVSKSNLFIRFKNPDGTAVNVADMPDNFYCYLRIVQNF